MKKSSQIAGLCGFVLLLFGIVEFMFSREFSLFTIIHLAGGGALVLFSLAFNLGGVWSSLGARSTRYGANAVLYTAIFLGILVLVNIVANTHPVRKDLTEGGLFSLSDQSQKVLDNLEEDVKALGFFQAAKGTPLDDLLKNYANYSPKFTYEFIDPVKNPERANKHEVTSMDILVIICGDRETKIPGISEEDITNAILKVANPAKKKIRFLTSHGERDLAGEEESGYYVAKKALENENYEVLPLELYMIDEVPGDTDVLVIASPEKSLEKNELEAIEKYIAQGGNALFLMDPGTSPGMDEFVAKWGVKVGDNVVVDQVFRLFYGPSLGVDPVVSNYGDHEITRDLQEQTIFHLTQSVQLAEPLPAGVTGVSLAQTSASSWAESDLERFFEKSEVARTEEDLGGPVSIAVALTVEVKEPAEAEDDDAAAEKKEARLVVFGDAAFIDNEFIHKMYNADLFLNTINWLAEEEELISIRPKTTRGSRVLMTPKETRDIFYMSVLILPEALLLFGLAIWWRRR